VGLRVRYGDTLAVDDVSLSISRGEIFGILGPNGAGKTTTVECIAELPEKLQVGEAMDLFSSFYRDSKGSTRGALRHGAKRSC
jgi:ABC-2 type transport system ATP-binding protein